MLGFARAKAASSLVALVAALAVVVSVPVSTAEAKASSSKKAKKKKPPPPPAESEVDLAPPATEVNSSDIEMTVTDPGPAKKPPPKKAKKGKKGKKAEVEPEPIELEEEPEKEPEPEPEPAAPYHKNWGSLALQLDFLAFGTEDNICPSTTPDGLDIPGAEQYVCMDAAGVYQGNVVTGLGNTVNGGVGLATLRLLLGYDRVFIDRLTVGGRLGWAFGTQPSAEGAGSAVPVHIEVRSAYYFGSAPFERRSIRPFAALGAGIGEIDGVVSVDTYTAPDAPVTQVDAWRKTGTGFIALGGGAGYPVGNFVINAELRAILMLGESAFALGLGVGAAYGF
jgi:hypothetical protein